MGSFTEDKHENKMDEGFVDKKISRVSNFAKSEDFVHIQCFLQESI